MFVFCTIDQLIKWKQDPAECTTEERPNDACQWHPLGMDH